MKPSMNTIRPRLAQPVAATGAADGHGARAATLAATARVSVLAEGDYQVPVPAKGQPLAQLLESLGIGERATQLYLDGRAANGEAIVRPGSRVDVLPAIRGG
jgi:hypothetical protein